MPCPGYGERCSAAELVVARRDPPTLFDLIEEPFDQVAGSVKMRAEADRIVAIASRRDVGPSVPLCDECSDPIGVIASVREQHLIQISGEIEGCLQVYCRAPHRLSARAAPEARWYRRPSESCSLTRLVAACFETSPPL
jgi:hypothetical protein